MSLCRASFRVSGSDRKLLEKFGYDLSAVSGILNKELAVSQWLVCGANGNGSTAWELKKLVEFIGYIVEGWRVAELWSKYVAG
jgi:hypothetical protein